MAEKEISSTLIQGPGEKKSYEKGTLSFVDIDREVKILWTAEMLLGREEICDVHLPDNRVSRKHAVVQLEYGAAKFVDLMSSNGSSRNGEPVQGTIILNDGDTLLLGGAIAVDVKVREEDESVISVSLRVGKKEYLLTQTEVIIGNDPAVTDITVDDPVMSPRHAQIEFLFDVAVLTDLGDGKNFLIDEHAVNSSQLKDYTSIWIGNTRMTWRY